MTTPIRETVAAAIATRVATVTTGGGYNNTISPVVRPTRTGDEWTPGHLLALVVAQDPTEVGPEDTPANFKAWEQVFQIGVFVLESDQSLVPAETLKNQVAADVEKALMTDRSFGGLCYDSKIRPTTTFDSIDDFDGVVVNLSAWYRHLETDPYDNGA